MDIELNEIKHIRKKFDLSQTELANRANVSQSLIAKIESGKLDPTYSKAKKIFEVLNSLNKEHEIKANEITQNKIISITQNDGIKDAIKKMKKYGISQMPVIEDNKSIGIISESIILDALLNNKGKFVKDIMEESPPVVPEKTGITVISNLLKFYPMVLVSKSGRLNGVITKADLLSKIYR
jgi:predicted transcriptional regulator